MVERCKNENFSQLSRDINERGTIKMHKSTDAYNFLYVTTIYAII